MRICVDMDGTICKTKAANQSYAEVEPIEGAIEALKELRRQGHTIIIYTARHMKTCDGNTGKVVAKQGKTLLHWLEKYEVEYDEIWFGKPYAHVYVDDGAIPFKSWRSALEEIRRRDAQFN
ncbi:MAG: HAD hydrolase family protein [Planctomycetes bacterium]|nr:HAD hydrolase family protein [Planctomycetota bacterium]